MIIRHVLTLKKSGKPGTPLPTCSNLPFSFAFCRLFSSLSFLAQSYLILILSKLRLKELKGVHRAAVLVRRS